MIPARYLSKCEFCGHELDVRAPGVHQKISGWAKNREGGGAHGVSMPERENRFAHSVCVDSAARGMLQQTSMFK